MFALELTNTCPIVCSECSRNKTVERKLIHDIKKNHSLTLEDIMQIFPIELRETSNKEYFIDITGNYGDAIYHPQFHEIIAYLKSLNIRLQVVTNGSYRTKEWWEKTCSILTTEDDLVFSIDGLEDTNHIYRKKSRWDDIELALKTCSKYINVTWKCIVFSHNEHQIEKILERAKDIGIHKVLFNKSGRFTRKEQDLKPKDKKWIGLKAKNKSLIREIMRTRYQLARIPLKPFRPIIKYLFFRNKSYDEKDITIIPRCLTGRDYFISCEKDLFPCCMSRDLQKNSWFNKNRNKFKINQENIMQLLKRDIWKEMFQKISTNPPEVCIRSCGVASEYVDQFNSNARKPDQEGNDNISYIINDRI